MNLIDTLPVVIVLSVFGIAVGYLIVHTIRTRMEHRKMIVTNHTRSQYDIKMEK